MPRKGYMKMDLKTLKDYRELAHFERWNDRSEISLDTFFSLLEKAENLHEENQWLYGKLNIISDAIEKGREDSKEF